MRKQFLILTVLILALNACGQDWSSFDKMVETTIENTIPTITTTEFKQSIDDKTELTILDARELEEYNVSHIKGAICIGYDNFNINSLKTIDKTKPIVIYCSVGYRSERIGEKLVRSGFTEVLNLYGGIFDWKNKGFPVVDNNEDITQKIHPYNKSWGKWITNGEQAYE